MPNALAAGLQSRLLAAAPTTAGGIVDVVEQWLISLATTFIDTPDERAAIVQVVMQFYDQAFAGKTGIFANILRSQVQAWVTTLLEHWAKNNPAPVIPVTPPAAI